VPKTSQGDDGDERRCLVTLTSAWEAEVEEPEASEEIRGVHVLPHKEPPPHHRTHLVDVLRRVAWALFWILVGVIAYLVVSA
jgi:hypothetical protein